MPFVNVEPTEKRPPFFDADDAEIDVVHYKYKRAMLDLLPPGRAFTRRDGTVLQKLLAGLGMEFSRLQRAVRQVLRESSPKTSTRTLSLWETLLGLPDCEEPTTIEGRRKVAAAKLAAAAGHTQELGWWQALFKGLDYVLAGVDSFGDIVADCIGECDMGLFEDEWTFYVELLAGHGADDELLECTVDSEHLLGFEVKLHWSWTKIAGLAGAANLRGVATSQTGWTLAVGASNVVVRSKEFLTTWTTLPSPGFGSMRAITDAGGPWLVAVGPANAGCLRTDDGGETWDIVAFASDILHAITRSYEDTLDVFACGENGRVFKGSDAGSAWAEKTTPVAEDLFGITRAAGALVAVGNDGVVIRSVDVGETWTEMTSGTTQGLRGVAGWGDVIVAVGLGGVILRSADAGATWTSVDSPTTGNLRAVTASPTGRWTACGEGGVVLQSLNAGVTWAVQTVETTEDLQAAAFGALLGRAVLVGNGNPNKLIVVE